LNTLSAFEQTNLEEMQQLVQEEQVSQKSKQMRRHHAAGFQPNPQSCIEPPQE
jgi:hypothetical protein